MSRLGVTVTEPAVVRGPGAPEESLLGPGIEPAPPLQSAAGWETGAETEGYSRFLPLQVRGAYAEGIPRLSPPKVRGGRTEGHSRLSPPMVKELLTKEQSRLLPLQVWRTEPK